MDSARPLHDVFAELAGSGSTGGDPGELLRDHGHPGLPADLMAEAVVSYADTAPAEVAEHLAPFVAAHSAPGAEEAAGAEPVWLDLLATAPAGTGPAEADDLSAEPEPGLDFGAGAGTEPADAPDIAFEEPEAVVDAMLDFPADPADLDTAPPEPAVVDPVEVADVDGEPGADPLV